MRLLPYSALCWCVLFVFGSCNPEPTSAPGASAGKLEPGTQPNIIIIFADDLGYGDLGCYGNPTIRTPHLDRMANEGMKFTQFYTGASVCSPSRAALLTGRLPIRFGMASSRRRVLFPFSTSGIPQDEITLAEALREVGYATAAVGKWHLGHHEEFLPLQNGFDEYFGIPYSNDMRRDSIPGNWASNFPPLPLIEGNKTIETRPDQRLLTEQYTTRSLDFIERNKDKPFFLYYPQTFPHIPLYAGQKFEGKSSRGLYGDVVEEIDWSVGQIIRKLKELELENNTLVFFTSDNGPWLTKHEEGGTAGLLHQGKGCTWEGGMRVPAIAWWPGNIDAGITTQALGTTMDLYVTAINLAGAEVPQDRILDGTDLTEVLLKNVDSDREEVIYYLGSEVFAYRNGPWKIHFKTFNPYIGEQAVVREPPLLYNLDIDPSERFDRAAEYPEIVNDLRQKVNEHLATVEAVDDRMILIDSALSIWDKPKDLD